MVMRWKWQPFQLIQTASSMAVWYKWILQRRLCVKCRLYPIGSGLFKVILHAYCCVVLQLQPMDVCGCLSWRILLYGVSKWWSAWKEIPFWNMMASGNQLWGCFSSMMQLYIVIGIRCVAFLTNHLVVWSSRMHPSWRSSYAHYPCRIHYKLSLYWDHPLKSLWYGLLLHDGVLSFLSQTCDLFYHQTCGLNVSYGLVFVLRKKTSQFH